MGGTPASPTRQPKCPPRDPRLWVRDGQGAEKARMLPFLGNDHVRSAGRWGAELAAEPTAEVGSPGFPPVPH